VKAVMVYIKVVLKPPRALLTQLRSYPVSPRRNMYIKKSTKAESRKRIARSESESKNITSVGLVE
jgi:hypothetical protein